jgi:hypothetical protein
MNGEKRVLSQTEAVLVGLINLDDANFRAAAFGIIRGPAPCVFRNSHAHQLPCLGFKPGVA